MATILMIFFLVFDLVFYNTLHHGSKIGPTKPQKSNFWFLVFFGFVVKCIT